MKTYTVVVHQVAEHVIWVDADSEAEAEIKAVEAVAEGRHGNGDWFPPEAISVAERWHLNGGES